MSQNRHDRMRHEAMQARRDLHQNTQPQQEPSQQTTPFFTQPVKVNPSVGDATAQRIQSVLGDFNSFQPYVSNQSKFLLGVSSGTPNTPKLDKPHQKSAPNFFPSAMKTSGPKNGALVSLTHKTLTSRSEKTNSSHVASTTNFGHSNESLKELREPDKGYTNAYSMDSSSAKGGHLTNTATSDAKLSDCDKREASDRRNNNSSMLDGSTIQKSKYPVSNSDPLPVHNGIGQTDKMRSTTRPDGDSFAGSLVSKKSSNLPQIVIPQQTSFDNASQDVDDIIKEMTMMRTPLTGIYTPHKDFKLMPFLPPTDGEFESKVKPSEDSFLVSKNVEAISACPRLSDEATPCHSETEKPKAKKNSKKSHRHHKSNKQHARLSAMSNSETSSSDSDSASDSDTSSSDDEQTPQTNYNNNNSIHNTSAAHNNSAAHNTSVHNTSVHNTSANSSHGTLTPSRQETKEPSWGLKNFLPDKSDNEKPASDVSIGNDVSISNNAQRSVELFSNDDEDKSGSDDDRYDVDMSDNDETEQRNDQRIDQRTDQRIDKQHNNSQSSSQPDRNLHTVHRIASKSPRNYTTSYSKSPENTKMTVSIKRESPVAKPSNPSKSLSGLLTSPIKQTLSHSPKCNNSSLESTPKKSAGIPNSKTSGAIKRKRFQSLQLSDTSDDGGDEANESDVDVVGVTPQKRLSMAYSNLYKPEPTNSCQKLDFSKSKSPVDDCKLGTTLNKQSPSITTLHKQSPSITPRKQSPSITLHKQSPSITPHKQSPSRLNTSGLSDKDYDRSRSKHKSKHKSSKRSNEKDHSIEHIMNSVKTERVLSPIHDSDCGIGSVCYDSDTKATILVKLNLSLLDHIPMKDTNLNVNLISPDSGISVSSNAGPNSHPGNLDLIDLKDEEKCVDLMDERFDEDRDLLSDDKPISDNKDWYKKDNKVHEDKERTNENQKIKYRDKEVAEKTSDNSFHSSKGSQHKNTSSSKERANSIEKTERGSSKDTGSRSSRHDNSSHRSSESRSKHHKSRHRDSANSKDSKRSWSGSSSSSSQKRPATETTSHEVQPGECIIKTEPGLTPDQISSDALTCHTTSRAKKPRHDPPTHDTPNQNAHTKAQACKLETSLTPPSNQPVNQNASSNATDKGENWSLDRRRPAPQERLLSADEYLADAKRLKHEADILVDKLVKSLKYTEAVLCFILCGYAMERDNISEANRIFSMYKDTLRLIMSINSRFRCHPNDQDITGKDKKLTVLSLRIQSLLSLKLFTLKKAEALKLKRVIDDHNKMNGSHSQRTVTAPSPAQAGWTGRSTGTPSPMSPTPSPAGSIGSVGSQGSSIEYSGMPGKLCNGGAHAMTPGSTTSSAMTSPGYVNVPQRIHSVTQQYLSNMHYLIQCHELWDQADILSNDCKEFFEAQTTAGYSLSLHSDIWQLVQYVRSGLSLLKAS